MEVEAFERVYEAFGDFHPPEADRPSAANNGGSTAGITSRPCWSNPRNAATPRIWPAGGGSWSRPGRSALSHRGSLG